MGVVDWVCVLCGPHISNDWSSRSTNLHHILREAWTFFHRNYVVIQKATLKGNWWLAASSRQCACSSIMSSAEFFGKISNHPSDSTPLQPTFGVLWLLVFPKTKITFEREEISDDNETQENTMGQLMVIGRTVWGPKVPTLKGTEASLSCVQCFLYLVSSSINPLFFILHGWIPSGPTSYIYIQFSYTHKTYIYICFVCLYVIINFIYNYI